MFRDLSSYEIELVSGGSQQGYSLSDGSSFTWTGPNGVAINNVTFVGSNYYMDSDGIKEYYIDVFAVQTYPLPDTQGFVNAIAGSGSPPVFVFR